MANIDYTKIYGKRWYDLKMNAGAVPLERECQYKRWIGVPAGRRSGKTERAKRHLILRGINRLFGNYHIDNQHYFLAAPTHDQAKGIFWDDVKKFLERFDQVGYITKSETKREITLHHYGIKNRNVTWHVMGLDKPERIEGQPWDGGAIDEFGNCKPQTWESHVKPALSTLGRDTFCWVFGVPEGRNHYYNIIKKWESEYIINPNGPFGVYSWFSSEVLPEETIEEERRTLDPKTFAQEYEASWETKAGLVFYAYNSEQFPSGNIDNTIEYNEQLPVYIGIDFNVDPMTAVLGHLVTEQSGINKGKKVFIQFDELFLPNSNTKQLIERACTKYPKTRMWHVTPCQSSFARQTVAEFGVTDRVVIDRTFKDAGRVCFFAARSQNPLIRDRVNATNSALFNKRYKLNSRCKQTILDYEGISYKEGSNELDLRDKNRGHISAASSYLIEYYFPIRMCSTGTIGSDIV